MKPTIYLVTFLLLVGLQLPSTKAVGEDAILNFLEELRNRMCHPIEKWGLPALDPFEIAHWEYAANNDVLIDFTSSATNLRVTGLSDFIVNDLRISTLRSSIIDITLPMTVLKSQYTCKGSLAYIFNLSGDGDAEAYVENFRVAISFYISSGLTLGIRDLKIEFQADTLFVYFEKLIEEPRINDFFHALINELGLELLHDAWEERHASVEQTIEEKINGYLGQYTLAEIIAIVGGGSGGDEPIFGPDDPLPDCKTTKKL